MTSPDTSYPITNEGIMKTNTAISLKVVPVTTSLKAVSSKLITKSLRNFDLNLISGETVYLSNEEEQAQVLAEVVSYDSNWLASFRLI